MVGRHRSRPTLRPRILEPGSVLNFDYLPEGSRDYSARQTLTLTNDGNVVGRLLASGGDALITCMFSLGVSLGIRGIIPRPARTQGPAAAGAGAGVAEGAQFEVVSESRAERVQTLRA